MGALISLSLFIFLKRLRAKDFHLFKDINRVRHGRQNDVGLFLEIFNNVMYWVTCLNLCNTNYNFI